MTRNRRGSPDASTADVMTVQEALAHLGLYDGAIDGIAGASTRRAVKRYKRHHGLAVDDAFDARFIAHVRETS